MWEIVWCIRKNNLFTGRTGIDKLEIICQTFGITLAEFFNDTDVLVSMTEEEKNMLSQWNLLTPAQRAAMINIIGLLLSSDWTFPGQ